MFWIDSGTQMSLNVVRWAQMSSNESIWDEMNLNKDKWGKEEHPLYGKWKPPLPSEALFILKTDSPPTDPSANSNQFK